MGLFGHDDEQDARLDEIERRIRRITEQIGELSVDVSQTRIELLKTRSQVAESVRASDLDPVFNELNESIKTARATLEESKAAADDSWAMLQDGSDNAVAAMRTGVDGAWDRLGQPETG